MFGDPDSPRSWSVAGVGALFGALLFAPVVLLLVLATAFVLAPVGIVGLPFLLWAFFGGARAELVAERGRASAPLAARRLQPAG